MPTAGTSDGVNPALAIADISASDTKNGDQAESNGHKNKYFPTRRESGSPGRFHVEWRSGPQGVHRGKRLVQSWRTD